jgi:hypothetical protein
MAFGFTFRLGLEDGTPADPPTIRSAVGVTWRAGGTIPLGARTLRMVGVRPGATTDEDPVLIVEAA